MIRYWKLEKSSKVRLSPAEKEAISSRLCKLKGEMPSDFTRQPRSLSESERWKATELRQFLLYSGVVVLSGVIPWALYVHFLALSVAMSILLDSDTTFRTSHLQYARQLLTTFVKKAAGLYSLFSRYEFPLNRAWARPCFYRPCNVAYYVLLHSLA